MKNGYDGRLAEKFSGLGINQHSQQHDQPHNQTNPSSDNDSLYQIMKAVETAEATIRQQVEENDRLRSELQGKIQELEKYNQHESMDQRPHPVTPWNEQGHGSYESYQSVASSARSNAENHDVNSKVNGTLRLHSNDQLPADNTGPSWLSSPSIMSISPTRHVTGDYDPQLNSSEQGLMPMAEMDNTNSSWKKDLSIKVREHEEEIMQLRKHLADCSIKEAQIRNEKYVLEKRIAHMRVAFDQQQQDLIDAASKALSYRQDIIEENIRLTYALQDVQQERSTFVEFLLPLLAEYSLQPPVLDALSIVSNIKVLFKHLQEKLLVTESKIKESQYQLVPWHSDMRHANFASQSPSHAIGAAVNRNGLELVPQPLYSQAKSSVSVDDQAGTEWDVLGDHQSGLNARVVKNADPDGLGRFSPLASRNSSTPDTATQPVIKQGDSHPAHYGEGMANKLVKFRDPVSSSEVDDSDGDGNLNERVTTANWSSGNTPYTTTIDDSRSAYPYLPPVYEEPSSFSEAADEDLLPGIEGLQISGEALPGRELQACGYSINGTTSCNFEWIRHLEDGSVNYIDGAKQPIYLVTADDVDTYLAIEVLPLDDRKRKGDPVKVFANDNKKITCDPEMQSSIERTLYSGHASYKVSLSTGFLDIWEPATLAIKKEGYSIKCSGPSGVVVAEKFSPSISVIIPCGHVSEFILIGSNGVEHLLRAENSSADASGCRDTIVLTLRFFILKAGEKRRGKKKGLFFNK